MGDRERPVERDRASEDTRLGGWGGGRRATPANSVTSRKGGGYVKRFGMGKGEGVLEQNGTSSGQTAANFQEFFKLLVKHSQPLLKIKIYKLKTLLTKR